MNHLPEGHISFHICPFRVERIKDLPTGLQCNVFLNLNCTKCSLKQAGKMAKEKHNHICDVKAQAFCEAHYADIIKTYS